MKPFVVLSLPRSRSFWLSQALSIGDFRCGHDQIRYCRTLADVGNWLAMPKSGSCETSVVHWWRLIGQSVRVVTVRRPPEAVIESLLRLMPEASPERLRRDILALDRKLDQLEHRRLDVLRIEYDELSLDACGELLFEFLELDELGPLPDGWWSGFAKLNLQYPLASTIRYYQAHVKSLELLRIAATQESKRQLLANRRRRKIMFESIEIGEESFETFFDSCQDLFAEHASRIGEGPDGWLIRNWAEIRRLAEGGHCQIVVARANGKALGYLLTLINPSLENPNRLSGVNTAQFVSDAAPIGLGRRISDVAITCLRAKSVDELWLRAGVKGDGPRLGPVYNPYGGFPGGHPSPSRIERITLMGLAGAAIGIGATGLIGSAISSGASSSAASQQAAAQEQAENTQEYFFNQTQQNLAPYLQAGNGALTALQQGLGLIGGQSSPVANGSLLQSFQPTQAQLAATPGYQFTLGQGLEATQNSYAAQGLGTSGGALKGAANYAEGLASTTYQQQFQNYLTQQQQQYNLLSGLSGAGQNAAAQQGGFAQAAASNIGQAQVGAGNALAAGTVGSANALTGGLNSLSNSGFLYAGLQNGLYGSSNGFLNTLSNQIGEGTVSV